MELLSDVVATVHFGKLLNAVYEEFQLFENLPQYLNILVVDRLVEQVVQAESTRYHKHEALVQLARDVEEQLIVVLQLEAIVLNIIDHSCLLLVEELPDFEYIFEVLARHFVKVTLLQTQLLLVLLF